MGMFASGPGVQFLLDTYGIHGTFLMLGAISSNLIMLGALLKPSPIELEQKVNKKPSVDDKLSNSSNTKVIFKNTTVVCFIFSNLLWNFSYSMLLIHLPNFAHVNGASHTDSALLLTMIGLGSTFIRILTGITQGHGGIDPLLIYIGFLGISGILILIFPLYSSHYSGQLIFSLLFGIYSGGLIALLNPLAVELVGLRHLSTTVGIVYLMTGIGYMIGPPVAGRWNLF